MYAAHIAITLCLIVIIGVSIYGLRELLWMRAYNRGFIYGKANPHRIAICDSSVDWMHNFAFYRGAFFLGARHAKGY